MAASMNKKYADETSLVRASRRLQSFQFRLRRSGVKNVVYIIEEISMSTESFSRYQEAVESAIASTQVVNGYFVKMTAKVDDTIRYLARMTAMLKSIYEVNVSIFLIKPFF